MTILFSLKGLNFQTISIIKPIVYNYACLNIISLLNLQKDLGNFVIF